MAQVQNLLTASMVAIKALAPDHPHARLYMREYFPVAVPPALGWAGRDRAAPADVSSGKPPSHSSVADAQHPYERNLGNAWAC